MAGKLHIDCSTGAAEIIPLSPEEIAQQALDVVKDTNARASDQSRSNTRTDIEAKIAAGIDALELADANWGSLTAGQKDSALRLVVRGVAKLARIEQGRLDAS